MGSEIIEFRLAIRPGRHDFLCLREYVKEFMQQLYSTTKCGITADFGSEKFAIGSKTLLLRIIPDLGLFKAGAVFSFDKNDKHYLYETCVITIVAKQSSRGPILRMLNELSERMLMSGSRVEENPLIV